MFAATWSLALAALAALAVAVDCACPLIYEPLNKTMHMLVMNGSMTWHEVDKACNQQFLGGFQMLGRDFLRLSDGDRALCQGHSVPLRLEKKGLEPVVWPESVYVENEEEINRACSALMQVDEAPTDPASRVGSLTPSTGQWRLVDKETAFDCAICQRAWIGRLWRLHENPPDRPWPYEYTFTFRLVATGGESVGVDEAIHRVEESLNGMHDPRGDVMQVKIVKVASDPGGGNGTLLRLKSTWSVKPDDVVVDLRGSYTVGFWRSLDWCPARRFRLGDLKETSSGGVQDVTLPDFQVATRWCWWKTKYEDGDWDAVWDDHILLWTNHQEKCREHGISAATRRLQELAEQADRGGLDLKTLVAITEDVNKLDLPFDWEPHIANASQAIVDVLSSLLTATTTNASSACHGKACAFLAADLQVGEGPTTLLVFNNGAPPSFLYSNASDASSQTPMMSLNLPRALASTGRIAVHVWQDLEFIVSDRYINNAIVVQVVSSIPFDETEPERHRPAVTFQVDNTGVCFVDRYRSVRNLANSKESSIQCPLVHSEGAVDTYWCNKWVRGAQNFTTGTFVACKSNALDNPTELYSIIMKNVLLGYTTTKLEQSALLKVASLTDVYVEENIQTKHARDSITRVDIFELHTLNPLVEILSGVVLTEERVLTASMDHVKVLVSDLTVIDPVVGFSLDRLAGACAVQTVTAGSRNVSTESEVDLVLGAGVQQHCQQLAVLAVSGVEDFLMNGSLEAYIKRKLMVVYLVVTSSGETEESSGNVYFEIQLQESAERNRKSQTHDCVNNYTANYELNKERNEEKDSYNVKYTRYDGKNRLKYSKVYEDDVDDDGDVDDKDNEYREDPKMSPTQGVKTMLRFHVATWSATARDWLVSSCARLRSTRASKSVVRCESPKFANKRFLGRYLIFEPVGFAEAFGKTLLAVLIAAGILSGVSLASIAATAAALPAWRKDLGHKILLQMALALSFNLALGFQSSLVYVDTASVACVAVGALRHFSYLAMFAWMLVMSGLQLRRMLSLLGSRATSNLLIKVAFFAWGVPTIAVASFLIFRLDMYQSDAADRGFCYPEGVAFRWAVQAPAATVLALNGLIFAVIFARVFSFCGWGKTENLQRHLNEHTFQMRRLRAVFYTFLLFGITWVFHLLADQGVFQDKYLYEYLFLMTASVHVFSLSCIFVFFDREARTEWGKVVAPVRRRWVV